MASGGYVHLLKKKGFLPFLFTQFLGAINDNFFEWIIRFMILDGIAVGCTNAAAGLGVVGIVFVLPGLLVSGIAGHWADAHNKRRVLVMTKSAEVFIMLLAAWAVNSRSYFWMLAALFLLSTQFNIFSPSKYGILPEMVEEKDLSRANGLLESSTFIAIILGSILSGWLFDLAQGRMWMLNAGMVGLAALGFVAALGIGKVPDPARVKPWRLSACWTEITDGFVDISKDRRLYLCVAGVGFFWFLGALLQLSVALLGKRDMGLNDTHIGFLQMYLAVGIGAGSILAGRLSGDKVELGLVPLGALGMLVFIFVLALSPGLPWLFSLSLLILAVFAGLFAVPLNALLQQRAEAHLRGRLMAVNNFASAVAVLLAAGAFIGLSELMPPRDILLMVCLMIVAGMACLLALMPEFLLRFGLWMLTHSVYGVKIRGQEKVPFRGSALLICGQGARRAAPLVQASLQRSIRFVLRRPAEGALALRWILRFSTAIHQPPRAADPETLDEVGRALRNGHVVCVFSGDDADPESFEDSLRAIALGLEVPVVEVQVEGLGGGLGNWPERIPCMVSVEFGQGAPSLG
ncbi:MAG TPA: MFS transporter [bacterium]|jgi:acyl-[acyl-carrier-protein]-phospholipid O-acyltransferase/long-chain-fatty-acid--[acyl-carrier-protein] ligase|nr:MFS transporter [bacterium]